MKNTFKPILFSTPLVQAIQNGTKTQTRRTKGLESVNENPDGYRYVGIQEDKNDSYYGCHFFEYLDKQMYPKETYTFEECPYAIGNILWVRETFHSIHNSDTDMFLRYGYKADNDYKGAKWKPSIFMPREACRIFLRIKGIRAERIWDVSDEDAIKEGISFEIIDNIKEYKDYLSKAKEFSPYNDYSFPDIPKLSFISLWESINGPESLEKNYFVWVIEFEKVERPNDFLL